jgi:putative flippase GtrA
MPDATLPRALQGAPVFLAVGLAGLALDTAVFAGLVALELAPAVARVLSLGAATVLTWWMNRRWTFAASGRSGRAELGRYAAVALLSQGFSYLAFLTGMSLGLPPVIALWTGAVLAAGLAFAGQRLFTFSPAAREVRPA